MGWKVAFTSKAAKQVQKLPAREHDLVALLVGELELLGPVRSDWKNYSKLGVDTYHCHLSYRWVACWRVEDKQLKLIEIYYAGSRENAPY
ncbi:MAG: hypothetical protein EB059_10655 [Alphaproteobacteria bacterium]|nr:hypothetical protein [Alphaproteobacteria bacterium]